MTTKPVSTLLTVSTSDGGLEFVGVNELVFPAGTVTVDSRERKAVVDTNSLAAAALAGITKADLGLSNVDNTSDATKNAAVATLTNKTLTSPIINTPTGIVKGDVGLGNVDNTSDANKPVSTAQASSIATKQPLDATLTSLSTLGTAADKLPYTTGVDTWAETPLTTAGRALIDDASASAQRTTLGVGTGDSPTFAGARVSGSDSATLLLVNGVTKGLRIGASSTQGQIEAVDNTGVASYQPLAVGGASINLHVSGTNVISVTTANSVGIGVTTTSASAILQIDSTTKGVRLPRMTTTQRDAISSPAEGLEIYNTTTHTKDFYNGTAWKQIAGV